jgi:hypothetical protein
MALFKCKNMLYVNNNAQLYRLFIFEHYFFFNSYLKLYTTLPLSKLAGFMEMVSIININVIDWYHKSEQQTCQFINTYKPGAVVIVWLLDLQLIMQSVPITTKVVSLNPVHGEVYWIRHYVIKFVSDLRQVSGFLQVLQFPPPIKLTATI